MARLGRTCLFCLLAVARLDAVAQRTLPDGYTRRVWQTQDGLPESTVQAFAQTSDHYLWIGTSGGLVRFDGARFVVFDRENTPQIHENSIFCLTVSRDGSLRVPNHNLRGHANPAILGQLKTGQSKGPGH